VNPDGTDIKTVGDGSTFSGKARYTFPVWSPEGGSLLFSSFVITGGAVSQSALHRADADGNGAIVTLAIDPTSQSGVGPGVPHFSAWSPLGDRIALTTSGEFGIGSMLLGSYSGEKSKAIAIGGKGANHGIIPFGNDAADFAGSLKQRGSFASDHLQIRGLGGFDIGGD